MGAYHRTLTVILEDVRVFRLVRHIEGAPNGGERLIEVQLHRGSAIYLISSDNSD